MEKTLLCLVVFALIGCDSNQITKGRNFYMGFTCNSPNTFQANLFEKSDIVNFHFEVPWTSMVCDDFVPIHIQNDWNVKKSLTRPTHKVYISVSPLSALQDKWKKEGNGAIDLRGRMDSLSLGQNEIEAGYLKYCKNLIDFFEPDFFNMASEANLYHFIEPDYWPAFLEFHKFIYQELKASYPALLIFTSVSAEPALENYNTKTDNILQRLLILQLQEYSDVYALTIHPNTLTSMSSSKNRYAFEEMFGLSEKPFALSIGMSHICLSPLLQVSSQSINTFDFLASLDQLLTACVERGAVFVINSLPEIGQSSAISPTTIGIQSELTTAVWRKYLSVDFN